jgi:Ubiquitin carboxyl-terminal hydrolase/Exonuclease
LVIFIFNGPRFDFNHSISEEVMKKTNQQDFIGTVPNIGFRANSMLYGTAAARAYAVCDPRKRLEEVQGKLSIGSIDSGSISGSGTGAMTDASNSADRQLPQAANAQAKGVSQTSSNFEHSTAIQLAVPATVRRVHSHRGKLRIKEFNYDALNASPFVGLENTAPNAYTNPILQVFFALPEVRECALAAQAAVYHHSNATSLWCELGFLFHMMAAVEQYSSPAPIQRVVTPSNFQRTFQQIPESAALGLLDNKESTPPPASGSGDTATTPVSSKLATGPGSNIDTQQMSQVFCRFLFQQLHREADLAILARNRTAASASAVPVPIVTMLNTIDSVFGYSVATTTTFLQSGTIELGSANKAYSLEVVYPILGKNTNTRNPRPSPSSSTSITPAAVLLCVASSKEKLKEKVTPTVSPATASGIATPAAEASTEESPPVDSQKSEGAALLKTGVTLTIPEGVKEKSSRIVAPAQGAVPSFASVLWGSYQRETHMRGWCSASETYEPFKQVRSLLSLPKVLTLLCGDTVRDPRDATLSGALGEAQSYGSMHTNFWSQSVDLTHLRSTLLCSAEGDTTPSSDKPLKASWLPLEIELAVYRSHGASTGSVYSQGRERTGSQGQSGQPLRGIGTTAGRGGGGGKGDKDKLVVSGRMLGNSDSEPVGEGGDEIWSIFDGATETLSSHPASRLPEYGIMSCEDLTTAGPGWEVFRYSLFAAVSHVVTSVVPFTNSSIASSPTPAPLSASSSAAAAPNSSGSAIVAVEGPKHSILHIRRALNSKDSCGSGDWWMFNDFVLQPSDERAAVTFADWRHPSTLFFGRADYQYTPQPSSEPESPVPLSRDVVQSPPTRQVVPSSVLLLPSLSQTPCVRLIASTGQAARTQARAGPLRDKERDDDQYQPPPLPEKGELIAFDGEFVSVQAERVVLNAEGQKVIKEEGRMLLARISIISDGGKRNCVGTELSYRLLVDDYILPSEPVIDYVTRFSGITPEDLNPSQSRHAVVPYRTAYLKLRYFLDRGCVFVGHGLQKDFETANIFVPPDQVSQPHNALSTPHTSLLLWFT